MNNLNLSFLIVDDHAVVRGGIKHILRRKYSDAEFIECPSGEQAVLHIKQKSYSLVFLDVSMPGQDGLETLKQIKDISPTTPVIMLSVFREEAYSLRAFQTGASAYLEKGVDRDSMLQAVEVSLCGKRYLSPLIAEKISSNLGVKTKPKGIEGLSPKEYSIFLRLARGIALKEIAAQFEISPKTVTTYRSRILEKLDLDSNAALAKFAIKSGLVE